MFYLYSLGVAILSALLGIAGFIWYMVPEYFHKVFPYILIFSGLLIIVILDNAHIFLYKGKKTKEVASVHKTDSNETLDP